MNTNNLIQEIKEKVRLLIAESYKDFKPGLEKYLKTFFGRQEITFQMEQIL